MNNNNYTSPKGFVRNPYISLGQDDVLYHFGLVKSVHDLPGMFGDVKFVCCGGTMQRMGMLAVLLEETLKDVCCLEPGCSAKNWSLSERYCIYKVGPVLCISHGIGVPSISVMLLEVMKLLYYAQCRDVTFFRVGTSGGIGLEPGTVVVSSGAVNGLLEPYHRQVVLGKEVMREAPLDASLSREVLDYKGLFDFPVATGLTMCADDFYEGQARLDGAFCEYTEDDKFAFLRRAHDVGVRNIEMESTCFASICQRAGMRGAIVCVTLLNRLNGDQVGTPKDVIKMWETRPGRLVAAYVKGCLTRAS